MRTASLLTSEPKLIDSLVESGVKITKATAGELHTTLLTDDG
jgi:hypothetical protein